jgi:hypothetical protein
MIDFRVAAGKGAVPLAARGATAIVAVGLALAAAGTASADAGKPTIHHVVVKTVKTVEHAVVHAEANVHRTLGGAATAAEGVLAGLKGDVRSLVGGLRKTPLGSAVTHPINTRSLAQIQALQTKDANLSAIIEESGIDNGNAEAAQQELQQEQEILVKANTLAEGIQNGTVPNTQEKQVLTYIAQAQKLQAEAHARFRNNIN